LKTRLKILSVLLLITLAPFASLRLSAAGEVAVATEQQSSPAMTDEQVLSGADARIARSRKGNLIVKVRDSRGRALKDAVVKIEQTRHAFLFGCNIVLLDPRDSSAAQKTYQERFATLFNYATLPFYWGAFEKEKGKPQYERLEAMARWCAANGIIAKGHPLIWQEVYPKWAPEDADSAIALLRERVKDVIEHYKGLINIWDVINEANIAAEFKNGEGQWVKRDGPAKVVRAAFAWAREAGKGSNETFIYNDYNTGPQNVALLTQLASSDSLPDAIGIQSHMHQETWQLARVWEVCETFARFGKPLHFTETTVISGPKRQFNYQGPPLKDWLTTPEEEARQADYVANLYTVLFSHPSAQAITWWDLSDDRAWLGAPAGLLRRDMSAKPAYGRLMSLIHQKWWTKVTGKTGENGSYQTRAFLGSYEIKVTARGKTRALRAEVLKNEDGNTVVSIKF
jgi:GH35 family endo-1,4-beta-xylanase